MNRGVMNARCAESREAALSNGLPLLVPMIAVICWKAPEPFRQIAGQVDSLQLHLGRGLLRVRLCNARDRTKQNDRKQSHGDQRFRQSEASLLHPILDEVAEEHGGAA